MKAYKPKMTNSSLNLRYALMSLCAEAVCYSVITGHLYHHVSFDRASVLLILFNIIAIGGRGILSVFADRVNNKHTGVRMSVFFMIAGYFLPVKFGINIKVILLAIGNAAFHSFASSSILSRSKGKSGPIGLFLAGDAMGLALSSFAGFLGHLCAPLLMIFAIPDDRYSEAEDGFEDASAKMPLHLPFVMIPMLMAAYSLLFFVFSSVNFPWNTWFKTEFQIYALIALGRALSGYIADKLGRLITVAAASVGGTLLIFFCSDAKGVALIGLLLLSMPLPLIIASALKYLPKHPAFVFSLMSAAAYFGQVLWLLTDFKRISILFICAFVLAVTAASEASFAFKADNAGKGEKNEDI